MEPRKVLGDWYEDASDVILRPSQFFEDVEDDIGQALQFTALSGFLMGVVLAFMSLLFNLADPSVSILSMAGGLILVPVFVSVAMLVDVLVRSALTHVVVYLLGGENYGKTLTAFAYPSALAIVGWIPLVNILVAIYMIYLYTEGISELHSFLFGKALITVLAVPVIMVLFALSVIFPAV